MFYANRSATERAPQKAQRSWGHQNDLWSTLTYKREKHYDLDTCQNDEKESKTKQQEEATKRPLQKAQKTPARVTKMSFGALWLINC